MNLNMKDKGFTLIEVLIAAGVGAVILAAVYGLMTVTQKSSTNLDRRVITQQDTRMVLDLMALEIQMASYNPRVTSATWSTFPALACVPAITASPATNKGIKIATANQLAVAMDLNASAIIGDVANEYIVYTYDGASTLTRNVSCGGAEHILGGNAPFTTVKNAAAGVSLFRYFDKNNNELTSPVANIANIRSILITIVAWTQDKDVGTQQYKKMVYSTRVIVRNHAFSR